MDEAGVERAIITMDAHDPEPVARDRARVPGQVHLRRRWSTRRTGMEALRAARPARRARTTSRLVRIIPFLINRPPNDKVYYPVYAKCIELDLPISVNTGIPGPPMPAEPQRPLYLDEVCLFYPGAEARHGARRRSVVGRGDPPAAQVSRTST